MLTVTDWHVVLACGKELHGSEVGSFAPVKARKDIADIFVETKQGKVFAAFDGHRQPVGFDFFLFTVMDTKDSTISKAYKLVTKYQGYQLVKYVNSDGDAVVEKECQK